MKLIFARLAFHQFQKLERSVQKRIDEKLRFYISQKNPLQFAESIKDPRFGDWKFRIGDYRVLFDVEGDKIIVLKVGHRRRFINKKLGINNLTHWVYITIYPYANNNTISAVLIR